MLASDIFNGFVVPIAIAPLYHWYVNVPLPPVTATLKEICPPAHTVCAVGCVVTIGVFNAVVIVICVIVLSPIAPKAVAIWLQVKGAPGKFCNAVAIIVTFS